MALTTSAARQGYRMLESDIELGYKIGEGNYGTVYGALPATRYLPVLSPSSNALLTPLPFLVPTLTSVLVVANH